MTGGVRAWRGRAASALLLAALLALPGAARAAQAVLVLYAPDGPLAALDRGVQRPSGEFADRLVALLRRAGLEPVFSATPRTRIAALLVQENRPFSCALFAAEPEAVPDDSAAGTAGTHAAPAGPRAPEAPAAPRPPAVPPGPTAPSAPGTPSVDDAVSGDSSRKRQEKQPFFGNMRPGSLLGNILSHRILPDRAQKPVAAEGDVPPGLRATLPLLRGPRPVVAARTAEAESFREKGSLDALLADADLRIGLLRRQSYGPGLDVRLHRFRPLSAGAADAAGLAALLRSGEADYVLTTEAAMSPHLSASAGSTVFARTALELLDFPDMPGGRVYRLGFTRSTPPDVVSRVNEALGQADGGR